MPFPWTNHNSRTDREIVDETNDLARVLLVQSGYVVTEGHKFYEDENPRGKVAWQNACEIMEHMTATDPNDALSNLNGEVAERKGVLATLDWLATEARDAANDASEPHLVEVALEIELARDTVREMLSALKDINGNASLDDAWLAPVRAAIAKAGGC